MWGKKTKPNWLWTTRLRMAQRLAQVRVPYQIGKWNLLSEIKWRLVHLLSPKER